MIINTEWGAFDNAVSGDLGINVKALTKDRDMFFLLLGGITRLIVSQSIRTLPEFRLGHV